MPYNSKEKRQAWEQEYGKRPEVIARRQAYSQGYRETARAVKLAAAKKENQARKGQVQTLKCPHCRKRIELLGNSTFVLNKQKVGEQFKPEHYRSDPTKDYRSPEAERRRQLAWYWRNRESVLLKAKAKRARIKALLNK